MKRPQTRTTGPASVKAATAVLERRTTSIRASIGDGFLQKEFGGKKFIQCLNELIKNARDWGADLILLFTGVTTKHEIFDNGDGMDADNRDAVFSINRSTAKGDRQSGSFCTGFKHFLYSFASYVEIRTAPKDEPGKVYVFSLATKDHERLVFEKRSIDPVVLEKTPETWPFEQRYGARFGTHIVFTLSDPSNKDIRRGAALARKLSNRLPLKYAEFVKVDDQRLPDREIVGEVCSVYENIPLLGQVGFELFRPKVRQSDEGVYLTATEIGEIPLANFAQAIGELASRIPPVFFVSGVVGTISYPRIKDFANPDRFTLKPSLAEDTARTLRFLDFLARYDAEIQRKLKLKVQTLSEGEDGETRIRGVIASFNKVFTGSKQKPAEEQITDILGPNAPGPKPGTSEFYLETNAEFELGETIGVIAHIKPELGIERSAVKWNTASSHGVDRTDTPAGIELRAAKLGRGSVSAEVPGTLYSARTRPYEVVKKREFKLWTTNVRLQLGDRIYIMGQNADRLEGELDWSCDGVGDVEPQGARAIYTATKVGQANVTARIRGKKGKSWICSVEVAPKKEELLHIRDHSFRVSIIDTTEGAQSIFRPVTMAASGSSVNWVLINHAAPGLRDALPLGETGDHTLSIALALEYGYFVHLSGRMNDPADIIKRIELAKGLGYEVLGEFIRKGALS